MARDNKGHYTEATNALLENFYKEDYIDSVEFSEKVLNRLKEWVHLLHLEAFKLTKFLSNVPNLADQIDGSPQFTQTKVIASSKKESLHVHGLNWDHNNDTLVGSELG